MNESPNFDNSDADNELPFFQAIWELESDDAPLPTITLDLNSSLADQLRLKAAEYSKRADKQQDELVKANYADSCLKRFVAERLLETGHVDWLGAYADLQKSELFQDAKYQEGIRDKTVLAKGGDSHFVKVLPEDLETVEQDMAFNAFSVIQAYAQGNNIVQAGTGLPSAP